MPTLVKYLLTDKPRTQVTVTRNSITYSTSCTVTVMSVRERNNGPAEVMANGILFFRLDGKFHREEGPATYGPYGACDYFLYGEEISGEDLATLRLGAD